MGPEQEARVAALLAAAAGPMLREEVDLLARWGGQRGCCIFGRSQVTPLSCDTALTSPPACDPPCASLPLEPPPRIGDEQEHVAATRARELERCRGTAVYAVGALACFLLPARSGTKAVAGVWRVLQRLASSAQHVAHGCHASKLMVPPAARRLASSLNTWLQGCQAAIAAAAAAAAARLDAAPEGQGQQQASAAATLATGLLRLTRQLPHLQRALNGCHGGADCRCKLCDGRDRLDVRMVRVDGLRVLTVAGQALELCG